MKLLFASDLHGSYYYASRMTDCFERTNADGLVLLGDILYHGARNPLPKDYSPKDTALLLNKYAGRITAVKGNCDSAVDQTVLEFSLDLLSRVIYDKNRALFLTHGDIITPDSMSGLLEGDVFISGHTHAAEMRTKDRQLFLNPGSMAVPKSEKSAFILYDDGEFRFYDEKGTVFQGCSLI